MALLVRPANVQKNVAATFTIDYTDLANLAKVPAGYYKNTSNWKRILLKVKNKASNQQGIVEYAAPATSADLIVSDTARAGEWELHSIVIQDHDRGQVIINREDIATPEQYDFVVTSSAANGDLLIANGEEVVILPNSSRQYGDMIIEAGGTLRLQDGGGICTIEVLGNCVINGTILANNGKHTGGTWNKTSPLSEALSLVQVQADGGNGGQGEQDDLLNPGGIGGNDAFGNGGGGGRSAKFGALVGGDATNLEAGAGAGNTAFADEYGEDGPDAVLAGECAGGGFRGAHGQGLWIQAYQIQGSGTINASGQNGGQGGDGGEFLSGGLLYANGAGGGGAGGNGGKVWLRVKKGTPALSINTNGGDRGARGLSSPGAVEAEHGIAGVNGSSDIANY